jgi:osmoprotectant transport system permease protein
MGMTGSQVLRQVEFPCSLPLIFSGLRSATLQVIATATIASYLPLGGLGRFIYDGLAQQDFPQMIGGGVLVALLALVTDLLLGLLQRQVVSRGISGRFSSKATTAGGPATADIVQAEVAAI